MELGSGVCRTSVGGSNRKCKSQKSKVKSLAEKPIIALLPGSRKQEILKKLPVMLEVSKAFPSYQFIVAKAPGLDDDFYNFTYYSHIIM